ncbi:MAG TPA: sodium/solute symporter [Planctomycetota bacterium]|nr:sodium/solute symporter [Planctomycetota bacterium]
MLTAFACYLAGVIILGLAAHRYLSRGSFLKDYFIGNRGLGAWVLATSFAATAISGGTFMGFPALIYTHGWVLALWIAGYMTVPLVTMAVLGKRINQVSRISGAVTIPDILRDRFESPGIGLLTSVILVFFLGWNLVAQFKAGGLLMSEASRDILERWDLFQASDTTFLGAMTGEPPAYVLGLVVFVFMVVAYTAYGGFWGVTLTDVLEGLVMLFGAVTLAILALWKVGGLQAATRELLRQDPALVYGPGPSNFLPFGIAVSFFFQWTIIGMGQPGALVRLMAFRDSRALKRAICVCAFYYAITYVSLVVVFICARALYPLDSGPRPDEIMPFMVRKLASPVSNVLAGFLLAAPYAAIMSTVAAYLLIVSSSLVRDVYQRFVNPLAAPSTIRRLSYAVTIAVGAAAFIGALHPPEFLQNIIVFSTEGLGVSLLAPIFLGLYWRRMTREGALCGMAAGLLTHLALHALGFKPLLASLGLSFLLAWLVSLATAPSSPRVLERYFFRP